jgi:excisionase family DNA binding protein
MQQERLLTTTDAARRIGVSSETIRLWENSGKLPATRTHSGTRLFKLEDVERAATTYRQTQETRSAR